MDLLLRLLSLDKARAKPQTSHKTYGTHKPRPPATSGLFDKLPAEIIQSIASWLPLSSSVASTLCNHSMRHFIGDHYLLALRQQESKNERECFLQALDRDILESYYCFYCRKLHLLHNEQKFNLTAKERFNRIASDNFLRSRCFGGGRKINLGTPKTYHVGFQFEHIQMAMKLYRRGQLLDSRYLDGLNLVDPVCRSMTSIQHRPGFYFFETRIVHNEAFVRAQEWILIPKDHEVLLPDRRTKAVYAHLDADWMGKHKFISLYACGLEHSKWAQGSCNRCQKLRRCYNCPTEVQMEVKMFENRQRRKMLIITKWMALGSALSPFDMHWESRLREYHTWSFSRDETVPGRIRDVFENQPGSKYDSILSMDQAWKSLGRKKKR